MSSNFGNGFKTEPVQFTENVDLPLETANLETQTEQVVL